MSNSTHAVEVVPVVLESHPNADALSIVRVHGYQAIVRTDDWRDRDVGAYCPPDSVVPEGLVHGISGRVKAIKLRGLWSEGLLVPAPAGASIGDNVADALGIGHYDPPMQVGGGDEAPAPSGAIPVYDLEAARRWSDATLTPGERVIVTEKVHGANGRWTYRDGVFHAGSRTSWKSESDERMRPSAWWAALDAHPEIGHYLGCNPGHVVYGEVYGQVQDLRYGLTGVAIRVFDIYADGRFMDHDEARFFAPELPWVPVLYDGPFTTMEDLAAYAEGPTTVSGDHVREGCVVRPERERWHPEAGRVVLKVIGRGYLSRKEVPRG